MSSVIFPRLYPRVSLDGPDFDARVHVRRDARRDTATRGAVHVASPALNALIDPVPASRRREVRPIPMSRRDSQNRNALSSQNGQTVPAAQSMTQEISNQSQRRIRCRWRSLQMEIDPSQKISGCTRTFATSRTREASSHGRHDRFRRFHARRRRAQARRRAQGRRLPRAGTTRARPRWVPRDCFPFLVGY